MRIAKIKVRNFRAIGQGEVTIGPFTVIIGANGVGKSSLLESVGLFSFLEDPNSLTQSIARWGGFRACVFGRATEPRIAFGIDVSNGETGLDYEIELLGEGAGFFLDVERFRRGGVTPGTREAALTRKDSMVTIHGVQGTSSGGVPHSPSATLLNQRVHIPDVEPLVVAAKRASLWQLHRFQPAERVRSPQQLQPTDIPLPDGSNLFSSLYSLKTERRERYRALIESLQAAVPELEELEFPLAGAGHVSLAWKQSNFPLPFYSNQLSDGVLRFLFLATILHTAPDDGLIMLDEPELSLHPQWIMLLVSLLRKTSVRTNVLIATQSAELIRWLQPEELVIADSTEAGTIFTPANSKPHLARWLEDFTLSDLWLMGNLGGRA